MPDANLKVFISWSGPLSKEVALALRGWLPLLSDRIEPFMSEKDIGPGQRGLKEIEAALQGTKFGIIVTTRSNQTSPWLNFEAGAMSKVVAGDMEQRVAPYLVGFEKMSELIDPLSQFQAKMADEDGTLELALALAGELDSPESRMTEMVETFWPRLNTAIAAAVAHDAEQQDAPVKPARKTDDLLEEVLQHVRVLRQDLDLRTEPSALVVALEENLRHQSPTLRKWAARAFDEDGQIRLPASSHPATSAAIEEQMRVWSGELAEIAEDFALPAPTISGPVPQMLANNTMTQAIFIDFDAVLKRSDLIKFAKRAASILTGMSVQVSDASGKGSIIA